MSSPNVLKFGAFDIIEKIFPFLVDHMQHATVLQFIDKLV